MKEGLDRSSDVSAPHVLVPCGLFYSSEFWIVKVKVRVKVRIACLTKRQTPIGAGRDPVLEPRYHDPNLFVPSLESFGPGGGRIQIRAIFCAFFETREESSS